MCPNRNEYQEYFLGGKGGWCIGLTTLPLSCAYCFEIGSLNLLEPSGPIQACNGTALSLQITLMMVLMQAPKQLCQTVPHTL
jgi:hypothetical protein